MVSNYQVIKLFINKDFYNLHRYFQSRLLQIYCMWERVIDFHFKRFFIFLPRCFRICLLQTCHINDKRSQFRKGSSHSRLNLHNLTTNCLHDCLHVPACLSCIPAISIELISTHSRQHFLFT